MPPAPLPRVPIQPLITALVTSGAIEPEHNYADIARTIGTSRWVVMRAMRDGELTIYAADRAAINGLNTHPVLIWGDAWLDQDWLNTPTVDWQMRNYAEALHLRKAG